MTQVGLKTGPVQAAQSWGRACALVALAAMGSAAPFAQAADTPMPYYTAAQALQSLYGQHLPARAAAFTLAANAQDQALASFCAGPAAAAKTAAAELRGQWQRSHTAWLQLSTPSVGPLVERRSLRQIDFTPIRTALITRAVKKGPQSAADMELVGTPAKGFGALDWLLSQGLQPASPECAFALQVAKAISAEAQSLQAALEPLRSKTWSVEGSESEPEDVASPGAKETGAAIEEWVNQWLGGLERLRWAQMEKPIKVVGGGGKAPAFARIAMADNWREWQTQWQALHAQALLTPAQRQQPPVPGKDLISIEALLLSKGHIALAQRWRDAIGVVDAAMPASGKLPAKEGAQANSEILALATKLKGITALYQAEVAPALDIPLGFSDSDGD